jgi:3-oxoacyl-[acyl-carrier-protein] synthase II
MNHDRRVVITGMGTLCSLGTDKNAVWQNLLDGETNVQMHTQHIDGEEWGSYPVHKVRGFHPQQMDFPSTVWEVLRSKRDGMENTDLLYFLSVVHLALGDSGLSYDHKDNRIGLVVTHENPGVDKLLTQILEFAIDTIKEPPLPLRKMSKPQIADRVTRRFGQNVYEMQTFIYLFLVAKAFGLHGYSLFINNACASGLFALEAAAQRIRAGDSPAVVVAAGDNPLFVTKYLWFKRMGLYADDGLMKPFAKNRNGIVLGDGAAAVVMEERNHAIERGARIYAEYLGSGFSLEGGHIVRPNQRSLHYQRALTDALRNAGITSEEIDLLCPHGVGTKPGDLYEARVITDIFGQYPKRPLITAFKPYVGHNLGGCALMETILLLLSLCHNIVPPTLNCDEPDAKLKIELVREWTHTEIRTAVKMSNGFAGYNGVAVFRKDAN